MSTGIAHELRQPLNAMSIAAQNIDLMLEMDKLSPITLREKTGRILAQIERASKIMDRMRRFGRKTAGEHKPVALTTMAHSARSLMDAVITGAGVAFEIAIPDDLMVMAEELEIEQVLVNLIQNAADALGERRGGRIRFWSCDDPEDPALVHLNAEDDGPGFPPEVQKHALDAFFTTKPEGKGTGLGLSISHSILREHGGRILIGKGPMGGGMVTLVLRRPEARLLPFAPRPLSETAPP
jgi:C4-dicarboxylate-specific signal transduction histidine kinase